MSSTCCAARGWRRCSRRRWRCRPAPTERGRRQRRRIAAGAATPGSQQDFVVNVGDRVFFETDQTDLTAQSRATLDKQAQWLTSTRSIAVHHRRPCRRARHPRIQHRARRAPRAGGARLPGLARHRRPTACARSPTARSARSRCVTTSPAGRRTAARSRCSTPAPEAFGPGERRRTRGTKSPGSAAICGGGRASHNFDAARLMLPVLCRMTAPVLKVT